MDLSKLMHVFHQVVVWICKNWYMDFSELLIAFVTVAIWICQSCFVYFSPFAQQNQAEVWPRFQSSLKLLLWTKGVEWVKVLNSLGLLYFWQRLFYYKRHHLITIECCNDDNIKEAFLPLKGPDHNGEREMVAMTKLFGHNDLRTTNGDHGKMLLTVSSYSLPQTNC